MPAKGLARDESPGAAASPCRAASHDAERGARRDDGRAGRDDVFGIVGSAYMDALDLFPAAGIRFVPTVHEQGAAHMADGYARPAPTRRVHRTERAGHHQLRHPRSRRPTGRTAPWSRSTPETGSMTLGWRLPGNRAARDLLEDHEVPGAPDNRCDSRATAGARDGTGAAQHPARLLLRRTRVRDRRADPDRARPRWFEQPRRGGPAARRCALPR